MDATIVDGDPAVEVVRLAFEALASPADRNLLRFRFGAGTSLTGLARMYRTDVDTVERWLAALREQLLDDARFRLSERLVAAGERDVMAAIMGAHARLAAAIETVLASA